MEIRSVCAWCSAHLRGPVDAPRVSHGICPDCFEREVSDERLHAVDLDDPWLDIGGEG